MVQDKRLRKYTYRASYGWQLDGLDHHLKKVI